MTEQNNKEQCSTQGCCCGKKGFFGAFCALLIFSVGYWMGSMSAFCPMNKSSMSMHKYCPMMQRMQPMDQMQK